MAKKISPPPVTKLESEITDLKDKLARSLADYDNLQKRINTQKELYLNIALAALADKLLSSLDDFYLAAEHLHDPGLKIAIDKFVDVLKSHGIEEIHADDAPFDPKTMDCVEVSPGKQNTVITVRRRGYRLGNEVIRPAQVVVGKGEPGGKKQDNS